MEIDKLSVIVVDLKNGMLLNFKVELMKDGINGVFNNFGKESF